MLLGLGSRGVRQHPICSNKECLQSKAHKELPTPFGLSQDVATPFKLDMAILPQQNGNHTVVNMFHLSKLIKVNAADAMCYGKPYMFNWHGEVRVMKRCSQFMFERLGGFQCRQHSIRPAEEGKPEAERTQEEWDFGFDFIEKKGPRDHTRNRQLVQTTTTDSPIYRWHPTLAEKSLRNLSMDGVLAQVHTEWPLTLYDLDVRILRALAPLFTSVSEKAIGLHGEPGRGKTPVARCIAMALSRHHIRRIGKTGEIEPSFRQACAFDFFRGQEGSDSRRFLIPCCCNDYSVLNKIHETVFRYTHTSPQLTRPDIFDDGTMSEQPFKKVKAFTDVGNIEAMSKERWGASKWIKGQPRIYCVNEYDPKAEPVNDLPVLAQRQGAVSYIQHEDFLEILDPSWYLKDKSFANVLAVLNVPMSS